MHTAVLHAMHWQPVDSAPKKQVLGIGSRDRHKMGRDGSTTRSNHDNPLPPSMYLPTASRKMQREMQKHEPRKQP